MLAVKCLRDFIVELLLRFECTPPGDEFLGQVSIQITTLLFFHTECPEGLYKY